MADKELTKETKRTEEQNEEIEAFMSDLRRAEYLERVEKGQLTPEEQACREEIRKFIGVE